MEETGRVLQEVVAASCPKIRAGAFECSWDDFASLILAVSEDERMITVPKRIERNHSRSAVRPLIISRHVPQPEGNRPA